MLTISVSAALPLSLGGTERSDASSNWSGVRTEHPKLNDLMVSRFLRMYRRISDY